MKLTRFAKGDLWVRSGLQDRSPHGFVHLVPSEPWGIKPRV
jgi:hypothetical protein